MRNSSVSCTSAVWTLMESNETIAAHDGLVVSLDGGNATVRFVRGSMCAHCGACMRSGESEMELTLPNTLHAKVGDRVHVSLAARQLVRASLIAYAIPLLLLLLGVWLGSRITDVVALLCGLGGCAASFLILRLIDRKIRAKNTFAPAMTGFAESADAEEIEK